MYKISRDKTAQKIWNFDVKLRYGRLFCEHGELDWCRPHDCISPDIWRCFSSSRGKVVIIVSTI